MSIVVVFVSILTKPLAKLAKYCFQVNKWGPKSREQSLAKVCLFLFVSKLLSANYDINQRRWHCPVFAVLWDFDTLLLGFALSIWLLLSVAGHLPCWQLWTWWSENFCPVKCQTENEKEWSNRSKHQNGPSVWHLSLFCSHSNPKQMLWLSHP